MKTQLNLDEKKEGPACYLNLCAIMSWI